MCFLFFYVNDIFELNKYRVIFVMNRDESWDCLMKFLDYWKSKNRSFVGG